jgi:hypothetical protein
LNGTTTVSDGPVGAVVGVVAGTRIVCGVAGGEVTTGRGNVAGGVVDRGAVRGVVRGVVTGVVVVGVVGGGAVVVSAGIVVVRFGASFATTFAGAVVVDESNDGVTAVVRGTRDEVTAANASYDAPTAIRQNTRTSTRLITPWTVSGSSRVWVGTGTTRGATGRSAACDTASWSGAAVGTGSCSSHSNTPSWSDGTEGSLSISLSCAPSP